MRQAASIGMAKTTPMLPDCADAAAAEGDDRSDDADDLADAVHERAAGVAGSSRPAAR